MNATLLHYDSVGGASNVHVALLHSEFSTLLLLCGFNSTGSFTDGVFQATCAILL